MTNVSLTHIVYDTNGGSTAFIAYDRDFTPRQMDFHFKNISLRNIQSENNSGFRWRGNRMEI